MSELTQNALHSMSQTIAKDSEDITRDCCGCCKPVILSIMDMRRLALDVICEDCMNRREEKRLAQSLQAVLETRDKRLSTIPTTFRTIDPLKLPSPLKLEEALKWKPSGRGLLLHGATGCGKSRIAWEVCKREIMAGKSFAAVSPFELAKYPRMLMGDGFQAEEYAAKLAEVDLLLLDDVFKAKATERVEELLFAVIDERGQWERPCIVTLNDTGDSLAQRLSSDRGPAIVRRLRDYCDSIQF